MNNKSLYLEHFQLLQAPFRQEPDPEIFFAQAGRKELLQQLLDDIGSGKPLIKLTGSEGVGKTLLYLLLARKLSAETYDLVCLDHPVGSFEDLLRIICQALRGKPPEETVAQQSYLPEFKEQLRKRSNEQRKVILIIDEAEKIFLATLERLVRLICDTDEGNILHILLIGRPELEKNIDQLVIYCANVDVNAGYVLEPLTLPETQMYLQYRLKRAGAKGDKHKEMFSREAISAVYQGALGNISLTNMLAEKGLQSACESGSFRVDAEFLNPQQPKSDMLSRLKRWSGELAPYRVWFALTAVMVMVLLIVFLWPEEKQVAVPEAISPEPIKQTEQARPVTPAERPAPVKPFAEADRTVPRTMIDPGPEDESLSSQAHDTGKDPAPVPPVLTVEEVVEPPEISTDTPQAGSVVAVEERQPEVVLLPESRKQKSPSPIAEYTPQDTGSVRNGDAIFADRLRASSGWLAWSYRGGYTIQLMVLASETAEESLKSLLVQDDYYHVREKLYILRKSSSPALLVFYGLFDTRGEARRARNGLPSFLLNNQPYALSIEEALKKSEN